jgi:hypothetical protein
MRGRVVKGDGDELREYNGVLDKAIRQASNLAGGAVDKLRAQYPDATDDALVKKLETLFSRTVTTTGAATGGVAAVPGAGTIAALASGVGDGTFFLTASAAHVLAVASVYGIRVENYERQRALLLVVLAEGGMADGVSKVTGGTGSHVGAHSLQAFPMATIRRINRVLGSHFVTRYGKKRGILVLGRAAPFGLGVAIGGGGNFLMARGVIKATRKAFDSALTN